jgi:2-polyprenyl-3-methyl-5-hydroxy-6-metoxy-1,4-benzoquinol methylase
MSNNLCRVSNEELIKVVDFGMQPLGNGFLSKSQVDNEYFFPMDLGFSETSMMLQLIEQPEPEVMFHDHYAFFSSTSNFMIQHFKSFSDSILSSDFLSKQDPFVVELGCNDGIMLKNFSEKNIRHLGIEPSLNVAQEANKLGVKTISKFFNINLAEQIVRENGQADAFFAANVMCHIPDIKGVVAGIKKLLKPTGIVMFEDPYLGDIISKTSYDQIYDEHVFLFSGLSIKYLFSLYDMELIDMIPQETHGGSMRYVLAHKDSYPIKDSVNFHLNKEKDLGLDKLKTFESFNSNIKKSKADLLELLCNLKAQGKRVAGYAATSKSTTILNYCNIGPDLIEYICDTTPIKQGKLSPGKHIPVVPYEIFKKNPPDFTFLFAWNHAEEIMAKESNYSALGGKWITHVPEVRVF